MVRLDDVDGQEHIDLVEQFACVGQLSDNGNIRGSGVLVSETGAGKSRWVLTAADIKPPNEFTVFGIVDETGNSPKILVVGESIPIISAIRIPSAFLSGPFPPGETEPGERYLRNPISNSNSPSPASAGMCGAIGAEPR